jgi:hypothetical protein
MQRPAADFRSLALCVALAALTVAAGCGSKEPPAPATPVAGTGEAPAPVTAAEVTGTWTPEALEELLAPIALYPDPVLSQMLIASTNPQEVLDAGNWLLQNTELKGSALDDAAAAVGFTPPVRALVQFPQTVDMMCMELGWTTELGKAFVADQAGVLDAIQRLRRQAMDVGNLQSSEQMQVETVEQEGEEVVVLKPAESQVVYVPQYDPVAAYAPAPAAAPATTTTTTTATTEDKGHSTGTLVATGLLAFGAGILVADLFDDDDDWDNDYYYPNYGYGGMPYYPPYPYRPAYGGGYYPSHGYNRPPNYNSGWQNSGNIVINVDRGAGGGYWDRYDDKPRARTDNRRNKANSPISAARPNRPELNGLNKRQPRPMPADVKRPSPDATASNWKGQGGYAGASKSREQMTAQERIANAQPKYSKPASTKTGTREGGKAPPKVQGSYAGATSDRARPAESGRSAPATQKPKPQGDRGYATPTTKPAAKPQQAQRPAAKPASSGGNRTAVSGARSGKQEKAASQRGKQSKPQGARSKGGGSGAKKQKR